MSSFDALQEAVDNLITQLDYFPPNNIPEDMRRTPLRMAQWLQEFRLDPDIEQHARDVLSPIFPERHNELVIVKDITFAALCAHHGLPFVGRAHVGYVPNPHVGIVGLSKIARCVRLVARQMTVQERITRTVADAMYNVLQAMGVMVVLEAEHMCMSFRGVEDHSASTTTSAVRGIFAENKDGVKSEFLRLIAR